MNKGVTTIFAGILIGFCATLPALADQGADSQKVSQLLKQVVTATQAMHTMTADMVEIDTTGGKTTQKSGTVKLMKPNFLLEELWAGGPADSASSHNASTPHEILASDGQNYWQIAESGMLYKEPAGADGQNVGNTDEISTPGGTLNVASFIGLFLNPSPILQADPAIKTTIAVESWNGQSYQVISQSSQDKDPSGHVATLSGKLYIGDDMLVHRIQIQVSTMGSWELQLLNLKTGAPLTKADFAFAPPSWAKPAAPQSGPPK